jgi:GDP-L-fucose synthase
MQETSIAHLAQEVAQVTGYKGKIILDPSKPDGAPRKCLDSAKLFSMGWKPKVSLPEGLRRMYHHHFNTSVLRDALHPPQEERLNM